MTTLSRVKVSHVVGIDPTPRGAPIYTAAELALLNHADLVAWFDWKRVAKDANNYVTQWISRKPTESSAEQIFSADSTAGALVYYETTDDQFSVRAGYTNAGVANANHTVMRGNDALLLPTGTWYVADIAAFDAPAASGMAWSTYDATTQLAWGVDVNGRVRAYYDFSATLSQSGTGVNDGTVHLWENVFDLTNWVTYKDRTSVRTAATAMPSISDRRLRLNHVDSGGSEGSFLKSARESFIIGAEGSTGLRNAVKALVEERHPGLSLAA